MNHEIDHAVQFDQNRQQQIKDASMQDENYGNKEERRVITGSEQETAKKLARKNWEKLVKQRLLVQIMQELFMRQ